MDAPILLQNPLREEQLETISILLPAPHYDTYARAQERSDEDKYGVSFHDAVRAVLNSLTMPNDPSAAFDEMHDVVIDTMDNQPWSNDPTEITRAWGERQKAAKHFVEDILTAADIFLARYRPTLEKIGDVVALDRFHRLSEDTYRVDFTRISKQYYTNDEDTETCLPKHNSLDLMQSSQSTRVSSAHRIGRL